MTPDERDAIVNVSRPFRFDYVIVLRETKEKTISHIKKRNSSIKEGKGDKSQSDKVISDFGYLDEHISDYYGLLDGYLSRFFPNAKVLQLEDLPRIGTKRYSELISSLADIIVSSQESIAQLDEVRQRLSIPKDGVIELVGEDFAVYCERDIDGREYHYMRNSEGDVSELSLEKTIVADIAATSSQDDLQNGKVVGNQISTDDFDICGTDANSGRYMYFKVVRAYMPAQA
jgi:hypothetical protein